MRTARLTSVASYLNFSHANILCEVVKGKVKGNGYRPGEITSGTNDYCIVCVDGSWRFVDQHWGSQFLIQNEDGDPGAIIGNPSDSLTRVKSGSGNVGKTESIGYFCDDFYFLTDPEVMIYTHYACDPTRQLLVRPITEDEFWKMAYLKDAFFELEMSSLSHPKCVVEADDDARVVFEFGLSEKHDCRFAYSLLRIADDQLFSTTADDRHQLNQFVTMDRRGRGVGRKLRIELDLPADGLYKFELTGRDLARSALGDMSICDYTIRCLARNWRRHANPENDRFEWGPETDVVAQQLGLYPISPADGGVVRSDDGKVRVRLRISGGGGSGGGGGDGRTSTELLQFRQEIRSPQHPGKDFNDAVCHYKTSGGDVTFLARLLHPGRYNFRLFVEKPMPAAKKKKSTAAGGGKAASVFEAICNYLVVVEYGCANMIVYPPFDNKFNQTGDSNGIACLAPVTHRDAVIDPLDDDGCGSGSGGELSLVMRVVDGDASKMRIQLLRFVTYDVDEDDLSIYALLQRNERQLRVQVFFPKTGFYKLNIVARNEGIGKKEIVYQYLVNVERSIDVARAVPFPAANASAWRNEYEIIRPRGGLLVAGLKAHFKLRIPDVASTLVAEVKGEVAAKFAASADGLWECEVLTDHEDGGRELKIVKDGSTTLLTYQVRVSKPLFLD